MYDDDDDGDAKMMPKDLTTCLNKLLFNKRKSPQAPEDDSAGASQPGSEDSVYESQGETVTAIVGVIQMREEGRKRNNKDMSHVLTEAERGELVKDERELYEMSNEQMDL